RGEAIGVVLHAESLAAAAVALEHVAQVVAGCRALAIAPDADVLDDRRQARLTQIGRARAEGQRAIGAEVHPLEHAVPARVVPGEVVHALLPEQHEAVETASLHRARGAAPPVAELFLAEV